MLPAQLDAAHGAISPARAPNVGHLGVREGEAAELMPDRERFPGPAGGRILEPIDDLVPVVRRIFADIVAQAPPS